MERRKFSLITSTAIVGLFIPFVSCDAERRFKGSGTDMPQTLLNILSTDELEKFGAQYLKLFPDENNKEHLVKLILDNNKNSSQDELEAYIKNKIKKDFEMDETLLIEGWVLSRTEARQCALYSIN